MYLKKVFYGLIIIALALLTGCASSGPKFRAQDSYNKYSNMSIKDAIVQTAKDMEGCRYRRGGTSPKTGFDCSGFVQWVFNLYGIKVPRITKEQAKVGYSVAKKNLEKGDIVIFKIGRRSLHSGIYSGRGMFIHSPSSGEYLREESMYGKYWLRKFFTGRRVL